MNEAKFKYIKYGIAYIDEHDNIEMNRNLEHYPQLRAAILKHELGHMQTDGFISDLQHDMNTPPKGLYTFMLRHPSTWTAILPFRIRDGELRLIKNQLIFYLVWWSMLLGALVLRW